MKLGRLSMLLGVHDLSCALGELESAARRYVPRQRQRLDEPLRPLPEGPSALDLLAGDLGVAAVGFTIQLAIETGRDPGQMRDLERELIALLRADTTQE